MEDLFFNRLEEKMLYFYLQKLQYTFQFDFGPKRYKVYLVIIIKYFFFACLH